MRLQRAHTRAAGPASASAAYIALAAVDAWLAGSTSPTAAHARRVTKTLLMPALHLAFRATVPNPEPTARTDRRAARLRRGTTAGHALSWTGDVALLGQSKNAFLAGVAGFAAAHVAYLGGFLAARGRHGRSPADRRNAVFPLAVWVTLTPVMVRAAHRREPELAAPVGGYATLLSAMFAASLSLDPALPRGGRRTVQTGTTLFVLSDTLLATQKFLLEREEPAVERLVMATYTAGQGLIALGVRQILAGSDAS